MIIIERIPFELEGDIIFTEGKPEEIPQIILRLDEMQGEGKLDFAYLLEVKGFELDDLRVAYDKKHQSGTFDGTFPVQSIWNENKEGFVVRHSYKNGMDRFPIGRFIPKCEALSES